MKRRCNLVIVASPNMTKRSDFVTVARHVRRFDPNIAVYVTRPRLNPLMRAWLCLRPTLVFSPAQLRKDFVRRGKVYQGSFITKSDEYRALEKAGIPIPRWTLLTPTEKPDLSEFPPYVVKKPDGGARGAHVKIVKRKNVKWTAWESDSGRQSENWIVQQFVYTGQWPVSYRVTTLFGQVLYSWKSEADPSRDPLPDPDAFGSLPGKQGVSIVASGRRSQVSLNYDPEIIQFACEAAKAFPDVPLLGFDVVREVPSGKLYIIEANANGWVWHVSSSLGIQMQKDFGFSMGAQFDGLG